jgi:hypothetical protein
MYIIIFDMSFLKVSFSRTNHPEFLVLTYSIHRMIVSEENSRSKLMFLECTVAVICLHYRFRENVMNLMFLERIVVVTCPYCKCRYICNTMPQPSEECWWGSRAKREVFMAYALITFPQISFSRIHCLCSMF